MEKQIKKATKSVTPFTDSPKIAPAEGTTKLSPMLIYGLIGGIALIYFLTKK